MLAFAGFASLSTAAMDGRSLRSKRSTRPGANLGRPWMVVAGTACNSHLYHRSRRWASGPPCLHLCSGPARSLDDAQRIFKDSRSIVDHLPAWDDPHVLRILANARRPGRSYSRSHDHRSGFLCSGFRGHRANHLWVWHDLVPLGKPAPAAAITDRSVIPDRRRGIPRA